MDFSEAESDELFLKHEPDGCSPPDSLTSRATERHHQDEYDKEEEQSDEDSVDGEFRDKVRQELDRFGKPYEPRQEPPPRKYAAYHPSFARVETLCAEIFEEAVTLLESSKYQDKYTIQLLDMINRRKNIKYDPPSRVGIIGDSGVGKWKSERFEYARLTT